MIIRYLAWGQLAFTETSWHKLRQPLARDNCPAPVKLSQSGILVNFPELIVSDAILPNGLFPQAAATSRFPLQSRVGSGRIEELPLRRSSEEDLIGRGPDRAETFPVFAEN